MILGMKRLFKKGYGKDDAGNLWAALEVDRDVSIRLRRLTEQEVTDMQAGVATTVEIDSFFAYKDGDGTDVEDGFEDWAFTSETYAIGDIMRIIAPPQASHS